MPERYVDGEPFSWLSNDVIKVYKKRGSLRGSIGRLSWKKNHLGHWTIDNAARRTNVDYADIAIGSRNNGLYSFELPLIWGQIVARRVYSFSKVYFRVAVDL